MARSPFTTSVPEPIAEGHWLRAAKLLGVVSAVLLATDAAMALGPKHEAGGTEFIRFLLFHGTCNALALGVCIVSASSARTERARRAAMMTYLALSSAAIAGAIWVRGDASTNLVWYLVLIGSFRVFFDVRLGRWAFACAAVSYGALMLLLATGALPPDPLHPAAPRPADVGARLGSGIAALLGAWLAAHYVAVRMRTTEQELRRLAAGLEQRVQREVAERSRDLAEALLTLSRERREMAPGQIVDGRYRVVRPLGEGGMGAVWEAEQTSDGVRVAMKVLRSQADPLVVARFAREAQIAARIAHPNVVPVLDVVLAEGHLFLVMPLVASGSLDALHGQYGQRGWAVPLLAGIAAGLAALHERGVVHRDLKPANVLVSGNVARITDLGIARLVGPAPGEGATPLPASAPSDRTLDVSPAAMAPTLLGDSGDLTRAGDLLGTPYYMAPEQADLTVEAGPAVDVFALGAIAYELLTGRRPWNEPPILARRLGHALPRLDTEALDAVHPVLARCLALDPAARPTAAEVASALALAIV